MLAGWVREEAFYARVNGGQRDCVLARNVLYGDGGITDCVDDVYLRDRR